MGLNCKPGQRAWINVKPLTRQIVSLGIDQLHGHVVQVLHIHPASLPSDPQWVVDPPQWCIAPADVIGRDGSVRVKAGTRFNFQGVPDAYLRPFDDFPPEEIQDEDARVPLQLEGIL